MSDQASQGMEQAKEINLGDLPPTVAIYPVLSQIEFVAPVAKEQHEEFDFDVFASPSDAGVQEQASPELVTFPSSPHVSRRPSEIKLKPVVSSYSTTTRKIYYIFNKRQKVNASHLQHQLLDLLLRFANIKLPTAIHISKFEESIRRLITSNKKKLNQIEGKHTLLTFFISHITKFNFIPYPEIIINIFRFFRENEANFELANKNGNTPISYLARLFKNLALIKHRTEERPKLVDSSQIIDDQSHRKLIDEIPSDFYHVIVAQEEAKDDKVCAAFVQCYNLTIKYLGISVEQAGSAIADFKSTISELDDILAKFRKLGNKFLLLDSDGYLLRDKMGSLISPNIHLIKLPDDYIKKHIEHWLITKNEHKQIQPIDIYTTDPTNPTYNTLHFVMYKGRLLPLILDPIKYAEEKFFISKPEDYTVDKLQRIMIENTLKAKAGFRRVLYQFFEKHSNFQDAVTSEDLVLLDGVYKSKGDSKTVLTGLLEEGLAEAPLNEFSIILEELVETEKSPKISAAAPSATTSNPVRKISCNVGEPSPLELVFRKADPSIDMFEKIYKLLEKGANPFQISATKFSLFIFMLKEWKRNLQSGTGELAIKWLDIIRVSFQQVNVKLLQGFFSEPESTWLQFLNEDTDLLCKLLLPALTKGLRVESKVIELLLISFENLSFEKKKIILNQLIAFNIDFNKLTIFHVMLSGYSVKTYIEYLRPLYIDKEPPLYREEDLLIYFSNPSFLGLIELDKKIKQHTTYKKITQDGPGKVDIRKMEPIICSTLDWKIEINSLEKWQKMLESLHFLFLPFGYKNFSLALTRIGNIKFISSTNVLEKLETIFSYLAPTNAQDRRAKLEAIDLMFSKLNTLKNPDEHDVVITLSTIYEELVPKFTKGAATVIQLMQKAIRDRKYEDLIKYLKAPANLSVLSQIDPHTGETVATFLMKQNLLDRELIEFIIKVLVERKVDLNQCNAHKKKDSAGILPTVSTDISPKETPLAIALSQAKHNDISYWYYVYYLLKYGANELIELGGEVSGYNATEVIMLSLLDKPVPELVVCVDYINVVTLLLSRQHKPEQTMRRLQVIESCLGKYTDNFVEQLIRKVLEKEGTSQILQKDLNMLLVKSHHIMVLGNLLHAGVLNLKLLEDRSTYGLLESIAKEVNVPLGILEQIISLRAVSAIFRGEFRDIISKITADVSIQRYSNYLLKICLLVKEIPNIKEVDDFIENVKTLKKFVENYGVIPLLFKTFTSFSDEKPLLLSLSDINACLHGLCSCRDPKITESFSLQAEVEEILKQDPLQWVSKFNKLDDIVFHSSVAGLSLDQIQKEFLRIETAGGQIPGKPNSVNIQGIVPRGGIELLIKHCTAIDKQIKEMSREGVVQEKLIEQIKHYAERNDIDGLIASISYALFLTQHKKPHYTQIITLLGIILGASPEGKSLFSKNILAQVGTGQGKSIIIAMLSAFLAFKGIASDIITVNHILAQRDAETFKTFYECLGLTSTSLQRTERQNILYTTIRELLGDFANYQLSVFPSLKSKSTSIRGNVVIIDEVDTLIVDEGCSSYNRITLELEGIEWIYRLIWDRIEIVSSKQLETEIKSKLEYDALPIWIKSAVEERLPLWINTVKIAKNAQWGKEYVFDSVNERIGVVNLTTGSISYDTHMGNGLHQFLLLKAGIKLIPESLTSNVIAYVSYFREYQCILGLSGTLGTVLEQELIQEIYNITTFKVPFFQRTKAISKDPGTSRPDYETYVRPKYRFLEHRSWGVSIVDEAIKVSQERRPVLIILDSVKTVKDIEALFNSRGIEVQTLTDTETLKECKEIIDSAGKVRDNKGVITIATNFGGRGMDYKVVDDTMDLRGGMHVILGYYPENKRISRQAKGRTARQDKKGTVSRILDIAACQQFIDSVNRGSIGKVIIFSEKNRKSALAEARQELIRKQRRSMTEQGNTTMAYHDICRDFYNRVRDGQLPATPEMFQEWSLFLDRLRKKPPESTEEIKVIYRRKFGITS